MAERLLWVQLGVPDAENAYAENNIPTAAGYVLEHACRTGTLKGIEAEILPQPVADWAGDAGLMQAVLEREPDWLCLTCQAWNVERNLHLAERVKRERPGTRIIAGGPEITPDCQWLNCRAVDFFVCGEGETGLPAALETLASKNGRHPRFLESVPLEHLEGAVDPYSAGFLHPGPNHNALVETTRGCPWRCTYCNYSKRSSRVRRQADACLERFFRWAHEKRIADIYLLDPSFDARPDLPGSLDNLAKWNEGGIPLHTETRLEMITVSAARAFSRAGFRSVEVGLQSIQATPCRNVSRKLDLKSFAAGAKAMTEAGVELETGIILGLPGDSLEGFSETLEWLAGKGLGETAEVFHLSLLPGTLIREQALTNGWNGMAKPPYLLLSGGGWDETSLMQGVYRLEDVLGRCHYPDLPPWFDPAPVSDYQTFVRFDAGAGNAGTLAGIRKDVRRWAFVMTLEICMGDAAAVAFDFLEKLAGAVLEQNPFGIYRIVLRTEKPLTEREVRRVRDLFTCSDQYWNRVNYFRDDPSGVFSCRVFQWVPAGADGDFLARLADSADLLFALPADLAAYEKLVSFVESANFAGQCYAVGDGEGGPVERLCAERDVEENGFFLRLLRRPDRTGKP